MKLLKRYAHILFILLIPQFFVELLSSNFQPLAFFSPIIFLFLIITYGFPALLIADVTARWKLSWVGILLLGYAYGIYNEAIIAKTFFNIYTPNYALENQGIFFGINVPWAFSIISVHTFFSMLFPILLARYLWPNQAEKPFLPKYMQVALLTLTATIGGLFYFTQKDYHPLSYFLFFVITMVAFVVIAKYRFSNNPLQIPAGPLKRFLPAFFGFSVAPVFLFIPFAVVSLFHVGWITLILVTLFMIVAYILAARRLNWITEPIIYAVIIGCYTGLTLIGIFMAQSTGKLDSVIWNTLWIFLLPLFLFRLNTKKSY